MQPPKPYREERPWGAELWLNKDYDSPSMVKILTVKPSERLSLQYHHDRDEFWHVLSGNGFAIVGSQKVPLSPGNEQFVPRLTHHSLEGGTEMLAILELAFGVFDENDIVRLEDKYGRVNK